MYNITIIKVKEKGEKNKTNEFIKKSFKNSNYYLQMIKFNV